MLLEILTEDDCHRRQYYALQENLNWQRHIRASILVKGVEFLPNTKLSLFTSLEYLFSAKETELVGFIWRSMWTIIQKGTVMEPVYPDYQSCTLSTHIYPKLYTLFVLTVINSKGTINIFTSEISEFYMVLPLFLWQKKKFWKKLWIVICSSIWADKNVQKKQKENEEEVIFQTNNNYFYYYYFNMHFKFFFKL